MDYSRNLEVNMKDLVKWIKNNRNMPVKVLIKKINQKLKGHYQYYGVTDSTICVKRYL